MVGDAADQSLENSPGRRVDLIFERMDRVSLSTSRILNFIGGHELDLRIY